MECETVGSKMLVHFRVHHFEPRSKTRFANRINGKGKRSGGTRYVVKDSHFKGLKGDVWKDIVESPDSSDIVRQQFRVEAFWVDNYRYEYRDQTLNISRISGVKGVSKLVNFNGLPLSPIRVSAAVGVGAVLLDGVVGFDDCGIGADSPPS